MSYHVTDNTSLLHSMMKWTEYIMGSSSLLILIHQLLVFFIQPSLSPTSDSSDSRDSRGMKVQEILHSYPIPSLHSEYETRSQHILLSLLYDIFFDKLFNTKHTITVEILLTSHLRGLLILTSKYLTPYLLVLQDRERVSNRESDNSMMTGLSCQYDDAIMQQLIITIGFIKTRLYQSIEKRSLLEDLQATTSLGLLGSSKIPTMSDSMSINTSGSKDATNEQLEVLFDCLDLLSWLFRIICESGASNVKVSTGLQQRALSLFAQVIGEIERDALFTEIHDHLSTSALVLALQSSHYTMVPAMRERETAALIEKRPGAANPIKLLTGLLPVKNALFGFIRLVRRVLYVHNERLLQRDRRLQEREKQQQSTNSTSKDVNSNSLLDLVINTVIDDDNIDDDSLQGLEPIGIPEHDVPSYIQQWLHEHDVCLSLSSSGTGASNKRLLMISSNGELDAVFQHLKRMIASWSVTSSLSSTDDMNSKSVRNIHHDSQSLASGDMLSFSPQKTIKPSLSTLNGNGKDVNNELQKKKEQEERSKSLLMDISVSICILYMYINVTDNVISV